MQRLAAEGACLVEQAAADVEVEVSCRQDSSTGDEGVYCSGRMRVGARRPQQRCCLSVVRNCTCNKPQLLATTLKQSPVMLSSVRATGCSSWADGLCLCSSLHAV